MKTILLFMFALVINLHCTACVDDSPYVPRDTIKPEARVDTFPPPPPPPPPPPKISEVFKVVEQMPRFPGCEDEENKTQKNKCAKDKLSKFIYKNLKYPAQAKANGVEGTVVIRFVVEKDGSITDAEVTRDIGAGCGEEAKRMVESMNDLSEKWIPGMRKGIPVDVQFNLPVKFKL